MRPRFARFVLAAMVGIGCCASAGAVPGVVQKGRLTEALHAAGASGVLLDWTTGRVLAREGHESAGRPGSILKPVLLAYALRHGIVEAKTRVYCRRSLRVGERTLACVHPADQPMLDAEGALAASCNTWFAALARRMSAEEMRAALQEAGIPDLGGRLEDADVRVLTALGLENITVTPVQVAAAYRGLLLREAHTGTVWNGLRGSVAYGMASNARIKGVEVLGKTGTAKNPGEWWTHGWFAGGIPGRVVLVVYVPRGDGGSAATLAGAVLRQLQGERP